MQIYTNLCQLGRYGVFNTDLFEFYGVENLDVDTKKKLSKFKIISKVIAFSRFSQLIVQIRVIMLISIWWKC